MQGLRQYKGRTRQSPTVYLRAMRHAPLRASRHLGRAGLLGAALLGGCSPSAEPTLPDPAVTRVGTPEGRFAGSESCEPCHEPIYRAWLGSSHRLTLRPVDAAHAAKLAGRELPDERFALGSDTAARGPGPHGEDLEGQAAYIVGLREREDVWVRLDTGRLQVFPFSFDLSLGQLFEPLKRASGGYRPPPESEDFWSRIGRSADLACYGCHATGAMLARSPADPWSPISLWREPGVGCEACHGPAGRHVDAANRGASAPIPWPGEKGVASADVCGGCHSLREPLASPFRPEPAHEYGRAVWRWANVLLRSQRDFEFRAPLFADLRPNHTGLEAAALVQSGCALRGDLGCTTCHDPHGGTLREASSRVCLSCHDAPSYETEVHSRHGREGDTPDCLDCHMPPILAGFAGHPGRDHAISTPAAGPDEVPRACVVCHEGEPRLAEVWPRWPQRSWETRRRRKISEAVEAALAGREGATVALVALATDARQGWFVQLATLRLLRDLAPAGWDADRARPVLELLGSPNGEIAREAARVAARIGTSEARDALAALALHDDPYVALAAAEALGSTGDPRYLPALERLRVRPELAADYLVHFVYGRAALRSGMPELAREALATAVELYPLRLDVVHALAVAHARLGARGEAQALLQRILEWNPRFTAARQALRELEASRSPEEPG